MKHLKSGFDLEAFFERVAAGPSRVLMLDYDGTLAPFREERDAALPYPGVRERLSVLIAAGHTRVVLISGRRADEVVRLAGLSPSPEVWGSHGWERLGPDGSYSLAELPPGAVQGLAEAVAAIAQTYRARVEKKPASVAFHLRGLNASQAAAASAHVKAAWQAVAGARGMEVHPFDGGWELRVPGHNKGTAVRRLLDEGGPNANSAYLGDDLTDEDAFEAIADRGLGVLVRPEFRETAAALWLIPPEELLAFLDRWRTACRSLP